MLRGVSHEEVHALLAIYAAGALPAAQASAVRAHLASGCTDCLATLFRHPVGLPRPSTHAPPRPWPAAIVAVALIGVLAGFGAAWIVQARRADELTARALVDALRAQLVQAEGERQRVQTRVDGLERDLAAVRVEAGEQRDRLAALADARAQAARDLGAAEERIAVLTRGVQRRDGEIDRLLAGADDGRAVRELVATPGLRVLPLVASAGGHGSVRGHVLWHPERAVVVVGLFDLPPLPAGAAYRVSVRGEADGEPELSRLKPDARGDAIVSMRLRQAPGSRLTVAVDRDPPGEPVVASE